MVSITSFFFFSFSISQHLLGDWNEPWTYKLLPKDAWRLQPGLRASPEHVDLLQFFFQTPQAAHEDEMSQTNTWGTWSRVYCPRRSFLSNYWRSLLHPTQARLQTQGHLEYSAGFEGTDHQVCWGVCSQPSNHRVQSSHANACRQSMHMAVPHLKSGPSAYPPCWSPTQS